MTLEHFHSDGTTPEVNEALKMSERGLQIAKLVPFSILLEIPSGPLAMPCLSLPITIATSSGVQDRLDSEYAQSQLSSNSDGSKGWDFSAKQEEK